MIRVFNLKDTATPMKRRLIEPRAPRRPNMKAGLWLAWAISATGLLGLSSLLFAEAITFPDTRQFSGHFVPASAAKSIAIPAQIPLASVLVREGDSITKGQRVALFDQVMMQAQIERLQHTIAVNELERACLLASMPSRNGDRLQDPTAGHSIEQQAALARCKLRKRENAIAREELRRQRDALMRQIDLQNREASQRLRFADPSVRHVLSLRAAIERNAQNAVLSGFELALVSETIQQEKDTLHVISQLEQRARTLEEALSAAVSHLAAPYLVAPVSGRVTRVRDLPLHEPFTGKTDLVQIVDEHPDVYLALIQVPLEEAKLWGEDTRIQVRFSALPASSPTYPARLDETRRLFSESGREFAEIAIRLDVSAIQSDVSGQALRTVLSGSGQSSIIATLPRTTLKRTLYPAVKRLGDYF